MRTLKTILRFLLGILFIAAGINHFVNPDFYLRIMPPYLPWHLALIYISGVFQVVLGAMLLIPKFQRLAAWGLIALMIAVFPANVYMAQNTELYPNISPTIIYLRLPLQFLLIAWAYWYTKPDGKRLR